jgi:hypothetical protein
MASKQESQMVCSKVVGQETTTRVEEVAEVC